MSPPVTAAFTPEALSAPPNIVILMADDLGWADLGFRGSDIRTPNIDRLASEGVVLDRLYSLPICTPTRAALMTGRDPMKLGAAYAGVQPWHSGGVEPGERFMPEAFRDAGYQTAMVGKWHLGRVHQALTPNARGFEHFVGHLNTQIDYNDYTSAGGLDLQENGRTVTSDRYATDLHGDAAVRIIAELNDPDRPLFLYVPFLAPHTPMQAPGALRDNYPLRLDKPFPKKTYAAMVESLDINVGRILDALDAADMRDNTLVLFLSDNGGMKVFGADNGPWRGGKLETFEGGIRVAALARFPGQLPAGVSAADTISVMDLFPTVAALAGVDIGATKSLDGVDRWDVLLTPQVEPRAGPLFFASGTPIHNRFHLAVIEGDWKLVQIVDHGLVATEVETMLFDLSTDPGEGTDLSAEHPDRVTRMSNALTDWRALHPINGVRAEIAPPPGWRAPLDYAQDVAGADTVLADRQESYARGLAGTVLQRRHGKKGRVVYD